MKECDNSKIHISSKLHIVYMSSNNVGHVIPYLSCITGYIFIMVHHRVHMLRNILLLGTWSVGITYVFEIFTNLKRPNVGYAFLQAEIGTVYN
jgi:hypothetical protein